MKLVGRQVWRLHLAVWPRFRGFGHELAQSIAAEIKHRHPRLDVAAYQTHARMGGEDVPEYRVLVSVPKAQRAKVIDPLDVSPEVLSYSTRLERLRALGVDIQ